jgi:hypothetical protein
MDECWLWQSISLCLEHRYSYPWCFRKDKKLWPNRSIYSAFHAGTSLKSRPFKVFQIYTSHAGFGTVNSREENVPGMFRACANDG